MQGSSGLLLHPDRILKPALPSGSLSYSQALIALSLALNEVIMSSTYTCHRTTAIAGGWSFNFCYLLHVVAQLTGQGKVRRGHRTSSSLLHKLLEV